MEAELEISDLRNKRQFKIILFREQSTSMNL